MLLSTQQLFENCYGKYGIVAINVEFMEQILGLFAAAEEANAPFIIQTTPAARNYATPDMLVSMIQSAARLYPKAIFALHMDHGIEDHIWHALEGGQGIQFHILAEIQKRLPRFPLVLHGGSAVNHTEINRINQAGGKLLASAKGVDPQEVQQAIAYGICKVNIATDFRLLWTRINREFFRDQPDQFAPIIPGKQYIQAVKEVCLEKFDFLGAIGQGKNFN